jgi:hypothetical protein
MTVSQYVDEEPAANPWVQTPLRESYALSEAAGWYDHPLLLPTLHSFLVSVQIFEMREF